MSNGISGQNLIEPLYSPAQWARQDDKVMRGKWCVEEGDFGWKLVFSNSCQEETFKIRLNKLCMPAYMLWRCRFIWAPNRSEEQLYSCKLIFLSILLILSNLCPRGLPHDTPSSVALIPTPCAGVRTPGFLLLIGSFAHEYWYCAE